MGSFKRALAGAGAVAVVATSLASGAVVAQDESTAPR